MGMGNVRTGQGRKRAIPARSGEPVIDIYARLSRAASGETVKVDDQEEMGREAVERRGGRLGRVFKDPSASAWKPTVVRPQWEALMARLESGACDGVWVYDLTRFSRKIIEGERLVELAGRGIRVWSNAGEYDLATADGRAHFRESMVAAARESDKISERVKRGNLRRVRRGRATGGPRGFAIPGWAPVGPDWVRGDARERVPEAQVAAERALVRECYDRLFAGETVTVIVRDLATRQGCPTTTAGKLWDQTALKVMLTRASVAGLIEYNDELVGERVGVDPIVSREELLRLRAMFDARRRGRPPGLGDYLLSGLVACSVCGVALNGMPRPRCLPNPDGSPRREYRCRRNIRNGGCGQNYIDAYAAEQAVALAVKTRLGDPRRADRIAARLQVVAGERAQISGEIARLEEDADGLAVKTAQWGLERVDRAMAPITARLTELTAQLAAMDEPEAAEAAADSAVRAWDDATTAHDIPTRRAMIKRAFPRLTVRPPTGWGDHSPDRFIWDPNPGTDHTDDADSTDADTWDGPDAADGEHDDAPGR
jgi:site-specific DNA recombinase